MDPMLNTPLAYDKNTDYDTPFTHEMDPVYQSKITSTKKLIKTLANERFSENEWSIFKRSLKKINDIETMILTFIHAKNSLTKQNKIEKVFEMYIQCIPTDYKAALFFEIDVIIAEKSVDEIKDIFFKKNSNDNNISKDLKNAFNTKNSITRYNVTKQFHGMISKKSFEECTKVYARMKHMNINDCSLIKI